MKQQQKHRDFLTCYPRAFFQLFQLWQLLFGCSCFLLETFGCVSSMKIKKLKELMIGFDIYF
jgi:hypothetical protein